MAMAQPKLMERIELVPEQIVQIRRHKSRAAITPTKALRSAGVNDRGAYIPVEGSIEKHGKLVAEVVQLDDDEPIPDDGIAISPEGAADRGKGPALTLRLTDTHLEALGYDQEAIEADERPPVLVFAGDGYIAFGRTPSETVEVPDRAPGGGHLSLASREDLLRVWEETDGDIAAGAERFAVSEGELRDAYVEAGLIDERDDSG